MKLWNRREALVALGAIAAAGRAAAAISKGDTAPDLELESSAGGTEKLSSYRGKKNVVVAFFPKAFTGGCTREMKGYQSGISRFDGAETVVFGVSTDDLETQKKFAESLNLEFALLADPQAEAAKAFGVYNEERKIANRTTFVIDKQGKIEEVISGQDAIDIEGAAQACSRLK